MDPLTGEILALANYPTFDLNEYTVATDEQKLNRAAQHIYEPGSTFKSFIAAAALEVLRMPTSRMFDTSAGYISFGPRRIHDMHRYQALSFMDVIVKSSNVGAIKIGQALGSDAVSRYVYRFGFGETLARDIPHQRAGLVDKRLPQFKPSELASVSMGYQIGVTPLQMVAAVGSIANGGELIAPHVVRATIVDGVRTEVPRQVVRRTIPAQIADDLTTILEQVVERGTAKAGADPRLHHRRQDRHRREARERPLLEGPQQRVVRRLRAVAAPARGDPRDPRLAAPRRPHRRRSGGADVPRRRRGHAAPAGRAAHRARSARPAGRAERAGRADAGQPAGDRARADPRRGAGPGDRAGHAPRRPWPVGPRGHARAAPRRRRAAAVRQRRGPAPVAGRPARSSAPASPATWSSSAASRNPIPSAGSSHDPRAAARTDVVARRPRSRRAARRRRSRASGRRRRVRFAPRRGRQRVRRDEGREGGRRRLRPAGAREGRVRGGGGGAGAGRLDAAVGPRRRRSRRAGGAGGGVLRPPERRPARRRHHRHQRQDDDQLSHGGDLRRGRRPLRPPRHGLLRRRRHRARGAADDAGSDRLPADAARDGDQRLRRLRRRGVVARAGAEARRPRPLRRRRLHQPDPRSPRLPPRHGLVLRGQAPAVRPAAGRRDGGGERRRSLRPRAGRRRSSAASRSASTSPPTSTPGRSTSRSTA